MGGMSTINYIVQDIDVLQPVYLTCLCSSISRMFLSDTETWTRTGEPESVNKLLYQQLFAVNNANIISKDFDKATKVCCIFKIIF